MSKKRTGPGRPKGARNVKTIYRTLARETVLERLGEGERRLPLVHALVRKLQHLAMNGDLVADQALDRLRQQVDPEPTEQFGVLVAPGQLDPAEWIRRAEIENGFKHRPEMPDPPALTVASEVDGENAAKRTPAPFQPGAEPKNWLLR